MLRLSRSLSKVKMSECWSRVDDARQSTVLFQFEIIHFEFSFGIYKYWIVTLYIITSPWIFQLNVMVYVVMDFWMGETPHGNKNAPQLGN